MLTMKFLLLLLFVIPVFAQTELPDRGDITDLRGKTKVYVVADSIHRKGIEAVLSKSFSLVNKPADAEIILEYKILSSEPIGTLGMTIEDGQLDAYYYKNGRKTVAWSDGVGASGIHWNAGEKLAKRFIKEFKKM